MTHAELIIVLSRELTRRRSEIITLERNLANNQLELAKLEAELDVLLGIPIEPDLREENLRRLRLAVVFGKHKPAWIP